MMPHPSDAKHLKDSDLQHLEHQKYLQDQGSSRAQTDEALMTDEEITRETLAIFYKHCERALSIECERKD